jgi:hypothetical protein
MSRNQHNTTRAIDQLTMERIFCIASMIAFDQRRSGPPAHAALPLITLDLGRHRRIVRCP